MSKFKVGDEFNHPYYGKVKIVYHVEGAYYCKDGKGNNIEITESEMPSIPFQTVYAVCDEIGIRTLHLDEAEAIAVNREYDLTIRPYALTPINE